MARCSSHPEDEDKCLEKGLNRAPDLHLKDFRALKPLILLANVKHNMSKVHIFFPLLIVACSVIITLYMFLIIPM